MLALAPASAVSQTSKQPRQGPSRVHLPGRTGRQKNSQRARRLTAVLRPAPHRSPDKMVTATRHQAPSSNGADGIEMMESCELRRRGNPGDRHEAPPRSGNGGSAVAAGEEAAAVERAFADTPVPSWREQLTVRAFVVWQRLDRAKAEAFAPAIAPGLICGDGIWVLPQSVLALAKVKPPICMKFLSRTMNDKVDVFLKTLS
jgi:hypothetical protein